MFDDFSDRARRIVFFSRVLAGRRGAAAIEVQDLMEALVIEDQADYGEVWPERNDPGVAVSVIPAHRAFLAAETAAVIQRGLEPLLPKAKPLPGSVDMPLSDGAQHLLMAAKEWSEEMRGGPATPSRIEVQHVEPLHLLAVALADETSESAEVLKQAGVAKEALIAAIKSGEYS
jgi:hypothetical protein